MQLYLKLFGIGFQDTFVYRWNFLLRSMASVVPLLATLMLWESVCESNGTVHSYNFGSMVFYFVTILIVENLASPTEDEWRIAAEIREGQISALLVKPISYIRYRICLFFSYRILYTLVTLPVLLGVVWYFRGQIVWPTSFVTWIYFFTAVLSSALLQFFIAFSLAMLAFWILEVSTIVFILYSFEYFFSGHVFPLDLLSPSILKVLKWTPFPYELFFPVQILQQRLSADEIMHGFLMQLIWILVMWTIARLLWKRGIRHYQATGG